MSFMGALAPIRATPLTTKLARRLDFCMMPFNTHHITEIVALPRSASECESDWPQWLAQRTIMIPPLYIHLQMMLYAY